MLFADRILPVLFLLLAAESDLRARRIPNRLLLIVVGLKLLCYIIEVVTGQRTGMEEMLLDFVRAVFFLGCMGILALAGRGALGMGDVKLLGALALFCPLSAVYTAFLYGMVLAAGISMVLLTVRKRSRKDTLPFAPFLLIGYLLWMVSEAAGSE